MEHTLDWSVIWHNFDVIDYSTRRKEERESERTNKDTRGIYTKESLKGSRKESRGRKICPTTLLVLRQEDGAVRPEKKIALETHHRVVTKRNAKDTRNERIARPDEQVALDTLEKEDGAVRPEKKTTLFCRNETKRDPNAKRTKRRPVSFDTSEKTPYSRLPDIGI